MRRLAIILLFAIFAAVGAHAATPKIKPKKIDLWPSGPTTVSSDPKDTARIWVYLPKKEVATGRAIVICPGGGYNHLAMDHEGHNWATFYTNMGIAAIVLKYRMPHGDCRVPIEDAEAAIKLTRAMAESWNIKPDQVGIMGSSAGGHLASTIATHSTGDAAPNFQVLFYPVISMDLAITHRGSHKNFLGEEAKKKMVQEYSNDLQVSRVTPRAFIALSHDDRAVPPVNGVNYYLQCYRHDVPASLHVYPKGGHGWGYRDTFPYHIEMLLDLKSWLESF